ncbi:MAG TPA: glycosyltransferase family 4 protein [Candidatus Synoicihabitans sp.]|nr:glycosyltransferase family 4 protein [Candidatus Synoicihabitans sp.]
MASPSRPLRISILQGAFLPVPPRRGGAVEKVWFRLAQEFSHAGHHVTHVSRWCDDLPRHQTIDGVTHRRIRGFDTPRSLALLKAYDLLFTLRAARALPPADIVVTNTFCAPILLRPRRHGAIYVHVARYPKGQLRYYGKAARLQTVSSPIATEMRAQAPQLANRVELIPYPVETPAIVPSMAQREPIILYAGRIHPEKGLDLLLDGFAAFQAAQPGWRLRLAGPWDTARGGGGDAYKASLDRRAHALGITPEWTGGLFQAGQLEAELERAAIFVYPSLAERGETFGLAPLEAMARGCVPVVSRLECFGDFIENGVNGVVFDHRGADPALELSRALGILVTDASRGARFAGAARETAARHTLDVIARRFLESFESIVGTNRLPNPD